MKSACANNVGLTGAACSFSFQQQYRYQVNCIINKKDTPFHLHKSSLINKMHAAETAIKLITANPSGTSFFLCRYLQRRRINKTLKTKYLNAVKLIPYKKIKAGFSMLNRAPKHAKYKRDFSFKNNLTSLGQKAEFLELNPNKNKPQNTTLNFLSDGNKSDQIFGKKTTKNKPVPEPDFKRIFYLMDWQTIKQTLQSSLTSFLALYLSSFYERACLFIGKQERLSFYLDRDVVVKKCVQQGLGRSIILVDRSRFYTAGKCLNEGLMLFRAPTRRDALEWPQRLYLRQFFL